MLTFGGLTTWPLQIAATNSEEEYPPDMFCGSSDSLIDTMKSKSPAMLDFLILKLIYHP